MTKIWIFESLARYSLCYLRFIFSLLESDRTVAPTKIIEFRNHYQSCRIRVPYLELAVAAILVDRDYYSFFKTVQESSKVLAFQG